MANRFAHLALADSDSDTDAAPKANTVASAAAAPGTGAGEATQQQSAAPQVEKSDTVDSLPGGAQVAVGEPSKQAEGNQASQRELQKESMNTVTVPRNRRRVRGQRNVMSKRIALLPMQRR
ncbi:hypothetical protein ERJ75_001612300 [Trypanosoma vivax]|nr:hypothetical protein ERJ75_001612300 [Trypanosoma vivax]